MKRPPLAMWLMIIHTGGLRSLLERLNATLSAL